MSLKKPSGQLILDLVNNKNKLALTLDQVKWGAPEAQPYDAPRNTCAEISSKVGLTPLAGPVNIYYDRISLQTLATGESFTSLEDAGYLTTHDALDEINEALGLALTADDIEDLAVADGATEEDPKVMIIRAKAGCLAFIGQCSIDITAAAQA